MKGIFVQLQAGQSEAPKISKETMTENRRILVMALISLPFDRLEQRKPHAKGFAKSG
ncbi:MAG: hypothetical protein HY877_07995 [Deltaproteobacteria bacterium]|nr:hypothetical protein [Deltaproteobacteria bacterium]